MKLTAELSLYPLQDEYIPVIQAFIDAANARPGITIVTNAMSTQVCGDYERVSRRTVWNIRVYFIGGLIDCKIGHPNNGAGLCVMM